MKALSLQQGHTVSCKTSRDSSHNDGIRGSANLCCPASQKHYHTRNIGLRPTVRSSFVPFQFVLCVCRYKGTVEPYSTLGPTKVL